MNILIASDSFKDALSALLVCQAIEKGLKLANSNLNTTLFPLADGGEGTSEILTWHSKGKMINVKVNDPLFRPVHAKYGLSGDGKTAFIEMAQASGLQLLQTQERNPLLTSTFGTGELILNAIKRKVELIYLGLGGSATNDAGIGMATAIGFQFFDKNGQLLKGIGSDLNKIHTIIPPATHFLPKIKVICDVNNPLFGKNGAAHIYARQKGADDAMIQALDKGLENFSKVVKKHLNLEVSTIHGAGAAGGLGAGSIAFLNASLLQGIEMVMAQTQFETALQKTDLVITGEGKIDAQTLSGKLIQGVTSVAKKHSKPVIAFCGTLLANPDDIQKLGLKAAFSVLNQPMSLGEALKNTEKSLEGLGFNVGRLLNVY